MQNNPSPKLKIAFAASMALALALLIALRFRTGDSPSPAPTTAQEPAVEQTPAPTTATAPAGQIRFSSLSATDDNGDQWTLNLTGIPSLYGSGGDNIRPGPPLLVKADVYSRSRSISIGLTIRGQAGEVYQPGAAKNGRRVASPRFRILDEAGKVVGTGQFEYG
ncbi:MAG: hypothetical protein ACYSWW_23605 [Planctomycetota bacterium]|jgi:hypothetical protein